MPADRISTEELCELLDTGQPLTVLESRPSLRNHTPVIELNGRAELPEDRTELEAGANRCAVA